MALKRSKLSGLDKGYDHLPPYVVILSTYDKIPRDRPGQEDFLFHFPFLYTGTRLVPQLGAGESGKMREFTEGTPTFIFRSGKGRITRELPIFRNGIGYVKSMVKQRPQVKPIPLEAIFLKGPIHSAHPYSL